MPPEEPPQDPNTQAANQAQPSTEQLIDHAVNVDRRFKAAAGALGVVGTICAIGAWLVPTFESQWVSTQANLQGGIASAVSELPYFRQAVGECLLIPEGETVVGRARDLDDACMRDRQKADDMKSEGQTNAIEVGVGFAVAGMGLAFARLKSDRKNRMAIRLSADNNPST